MSPILVSYVLDLVVFLQSDEIRFKRAPMLVQEGNNKKIVDMKVSNVSILND